MSELAIETPAAPEAAPADPLAGGDAAGSVIDGAAAEPGLEAAPAAPVAPAEPAVDPRELQAELDYMREQYAGVSQMLERISGGQTPTPQQAQAAGFDPSTLVDEFGQVNPAALVQFLDARNQALLSVMDQRMQQLAVPLNAQAAEQQTAHYASMIDDIVADNTARNGDLSPKAREFLESRAVQMLPELNQRFGTNQDGSTRPRVLEMAIERAASEVRDLLGAEASSAQTRQANELATLAGAPNEPGAGAAGAGQGPPAFTSPGDVTRHYAAQARNIPQ